MELTFFCEISELAPLWKVFVWKTRTNPFSSTLPFWTTMYILRYVYVYKYDITITIIPKIHYLEGDFLIGFGVAANFFHQLLSVTVHQFGHSLQSGRGEHRRHFATHVWPYWVLEERYKVIIPKIYLLYVRRMCTISHCVANIIFR